MSILSLSASHAPLHRSGRFSVLSWLMASVDAWRSRRQLESLDAHMLEDIGINHSQARAEANRPIWDVPSYWLQ